MEQICFLERDDKIAKIIKIYFESGNCRYTCDHIKITVNHFTGTVSTNRPISVPIQSLNLADDQLVDWAVNDWVKNSK